MVVTIGRKRRTVPRRKSPRYVSRSMSEMRRILTYLRYRARATGSRAGASTGLMVVPSPVQRLAFLEHAGNSLIERRILHAHVQHGVLVQNNGQQLGHPAALDAQLHDRSFA